MKTKADFTITVFSYDSLFKAIKEVTGESKPELISGYNDEDEPISLSFPCKDLTFKQFLEIALKLEPDMFTVCYNDKQVSTFVEVEDFNKINCNHQISIEEVNDKLARIKNIIEE